MESEEERKARLLGGLDLLTRAVIKRDILREPLTASEQNLMQMLDAKVQGG